MLTFGYHSQILAHISLDEDGATPDIELGCRLGLWLASGILLLEERSILRQGRDKMAFGNPVKGQKHRAAFCLKQTGSKQEPHAICRELTYPSTTNKTLQESFFTSAPFCWEDSSEPGWNFSSKSKRALRRATLAPMCRAALHAEPSCGSHLSLGLPQPESRFQSASEQKHDTIRNCFSARGS